MIGSEWLAGLSIWTLMALYFTIGGVVAFAVVFLTEWSNGELAKNDWNSDGPACVSGIMFFWPLVVALLVMVVIPIGLFLLARWSARTCREHATVKHRPWFFWKPKAVGGVGETSGT